MQHKEIIQCSVWKDEPLHYLQQARAVSGPQNNRWRTQSMFPTQILTEDARYRDLGKRKEEELQSELTILNRSFPDPTEHSWQKIQLLGVGVWITSWNCTKNQRQKLLTRAVSRNNFKAYIKLFPSKEYSGTHARTCWTTFLSLKIFSCPCCVYSPGTNLFKN